MVRELRADPAESARRESQTHFDAAHNMEKAKSMHLFSPAEVEQLMKEYEKGIEILLDAAAKLPASGSSRDTLLTIAHASLVDYANHALRHYKYDDVYEYWQRIRAMKPDDAPEAVLIAPMAIQAHYYLGQRNFDEATRVFSEMKSIAESSSLGKLEMESYHPAAYLEIARRAKELAAKPAAPEYTVRILSPRFGRIVFKWDRKESDGSTVHVSTSPLKLRVGDVDLADLAEDSLRQTILAMSDGKLDLQFDRMNITDGVEVPRPFGSSSAGNGDDILNDLQGPLGDSLREKLKTSDVVFLFWWGTDPLTQHGGSHTFSIGGRKRSRGNVNIGVQFFHYDPKLDYMNCGACPVPNGVGFYPHVYMHEFFHVIEARFGIKPVHGFTVPAAFPDWHGKDEVDYYYWQIHDRIPAQRPANRGGWREFNYSN